MPKKRSTSTEVHQRGEDGFTERAYRSGLTECSADLGEHPTAPEGPPGASQVVPCPDFENR